MAPAFGDGEVTRLASRPASSKGEMTVPASPIQVITSKSQEARHIRRVGFIWLFVLVFLAGNLWDWFGGHSWGPQQSGGNSMWVHASAALFWLGVAMLSLCLKDLSSFLIHRSPPPVGGQLPARGPWWIRPILWWDHHLGRPIHRIASKNQALVGLVFLAAGAVFGHFVWKP